MNANNSPYDNGEFERAVREAGVGRAVMLGESLAAACAALVRLFTRVEKSFSGPEQADPPLTPRVSAAHRFASGD